MPTAKSSPNAQLKKRNRVSFSKIAISIDAEGNMKYAANSKSFCIPTSVGTDWTMYSYDEGGVLHEITKAGEGEERVELATAGLVSRKLSDKVIKATLVGRINGTDIKHLRKLITEGNLLSINLTEAQVVTGGVAYYQNFKTANNEMGQSAFQNFKKLININLPQSLTKIGKEAFSKTGLKMIVIPDKVTTVGGDAFAYCDQLTTVVVGERVKTMEQGVFYDSKVKNVYVKAHTPPTVNDYLFSSKPLIHVYSSDLAAYKASRWAEFGTIVGDLENSEVITAIDTPNEEISSGEDSDEAIYNLQGMKVKDPQPGTIFIQGGRKITK